MTNCFLVSRVLAESDSESIPTSTPIKKRQQKNLRVKTLEEIKLERVQAESAAFYAYQSTPVKPESDTTVASTLTSGWDSDGDSDLRAKILSRKSHRSSKADADFRVMTLDEIRKRRPHEEGHYSAVEEKISVAVNSSRDITGGAISVKQFKNGFKVENNGVTSEARFQTRQKRFKSDYSLEEDRVVYNKGTVLFNKKVDSKNNGETSAEPIRGGHFVIKTLAQIRAEKNSLVENASSYNVPERSVGSDCLPQELFEKNSETEDGLKSIGDSNDFLVSGSDPDEKACFQQTNETKSDGKGTPRRRQLQLKRNNIDTAVPIPKRSRVVRLTSDSLKDTEVTVQVPASVTSNVCSDALKTNGTLCLETGGSGCVRLEQPVTNISGDSFNSYSKSVMNSSACDKHSTTSFNITGSGVTKSTDLSPETTTNPVTTSVLPGKHPDTVLSELAGNRIGVTIPSKSQSGERLESKLALAAKNADCVLGDEEENCAMKSLSVSQTERGNTDIDELLLGDTEDNCVILDAEEDILQDIDDLLND